MCPPLAPQPGPLGFLATPAKVQSPQSPQTFQAEFGGCTLDQSVHLNANHQHPPAPTQFMGSREPAMRIGPKHSAPDSSLASCWGWGACSSGGPSLLPATEESQAVKREEQGVTDLTSPSLWPGKWRKGREERSSSSWSGWVPELSSPALKRLQGAELQFKYTMSCQNQVL